MKPTPNLPTQSAPTRRRTLHTALAACLVGFALPNSAWTQTDDFADGNDDGWTHYDPLKGVGGTPATFEVASGAYRIHAPPTPNPAYGPARAGVYRPEIYTDFTVAVDVLSRDNANQNQFGVAGRLNQLGLGRTGGYLFSYRAEQNWLALMSLRNEGGYTLDQRLGLVLDPTHQYRMVLTGVGERLEAKLYDLASPDTPLQTLTAYDCYHPSGRSGLIVVTYKAGAAADVTFDNYAASVGSGLPPKPTLPPDSPVRFLTEQSYGTGLFPGWIDRGDFNGDGAPDLVVPNNRSSSVSVFLNKGDGRFYPKADYATGTGSTFVKVADLNKDGTPDLAVANASTTTVSVLIGQGDGSFLPKTDYESGARPYSIAAGDLNQDGHPDLVVANLNGMSLSVLLGKGDGTFQAKNEVAAGDRPIAVRVADLNKDGVLDIAVSNNGAASVGVLLGKGDGTFQAMVPYSTEVTPGDLQVGDFNGDSHPDLVVGAGAANQVMIFLGQGDGTLQAPRITTVSIPSDMAVADFNRDQRPDLAMSNLADYWVCTLINRGPVAGAHSRLELSWPTATLAHRLEAAPNVNGPWTAIAAQPQLGAGPAQSLQTDRSAERQFFRLRKID